jgi:Protein of unknown function (DUF4239)
MLNPIAIGTLVFLCTFGGALLGIWLRPILPEHHLGAEAKETVKIGIGLIATMTALLLGLVTASAKSSFDSMDSAVRHSAAEVLALDRTLARYGPETREIRQSLSHLVGNRLEMIWQVEASQAIRMNQPEVTRGAEQLDGQIHALSPRNDEQRWLQARAVDLAEAMLNARWIRVSDLHRSIPMPFLAVLVLWLTITFSSFGLFAPRNATVIIVLLVCALSVAAAIFLILEMEGPFDGLIRISPEPLRYAYSQINQ